MEAGMLYPLVPKPIDVRNEAFSGSLQVDGNIAGNLLLFRFEFDAESSMAPVCIQVEVQQKVYLFFCGIRDFTNPVMKSPVIKTDFSLKNKITILKVEPLVSLSE